MNDYPVENQSNALSTNMESTQQRLERLKKSLESRLDDVNKALVMLSQNPVLAEFQDIMRRV